MYASFFFGTVQPTRHFRARGPLLAMPIGDKCTTKKYATNVDNLAFHKAYIAHPKGKYIEFFRSFRIKLHKIDD